MRTIFLIVLLSIHISSLFSIRTARAADLLNGIAQRQTNSTASEDVAINLGNESTGSEAIGPHNCGSAKRTHCILHPTTLSYHPEVYYYRHYFDIIGHDAVASTSSYPRYTPMDIRQEEILTPAPEQGNKSSQTLSSARLSGKNKKYFQK
jgi:hypothetical protein